MEEWSHSHLEKQRKSKYHSELDDFIHKVTKNFTDLIKCNRNQSNSNGPLRENVKG